jgi:putative membrane protein insertion efficiency factor
MKKQIREIRLRDIRLYFCYPLLALVALWVLFALDSHWHWLSLTLAIRLPVALVVSYCLLHYIAIGAVLLYKAFAPLSVRDRCRFEPTCSTYMIMAIQKYGLAIGICRGIRRLLRCKSPNGGIDYP